MVARGDLGVEINLEDLPNVQRTIVRLCAEYGKRVIVATHLLESMIHNPHPTRAEVTDVANAIHDGTDAVMISGETAVGHDPVRAVETMAAIAHATDTVRRDSHLPDLDPACAPDPAPAYSDAIARAVRRMTGTLPVHRIVVFTKSGYSARAVARHRPPIPITALTLYEAVQRRCALYWGVDAAGTVEVRRAEDLAPAVDAALVHHGLARTGDIVIIVAGMPIAVGGRTNLLHIHTVGAAAPEHAP